jgi:DNA-binding transcriptional ArsR family regulator
MNDYVLDLPPEFCQYQDEGCEFAPSCLNCLLPVCVYEETRAAKMEQLFVKEGKTIRELSQIFKVSKRTVQRALKVSFGENGVYSANPRSEK